MAWVTSFCEPAQNAECFAGLIGWHLLEPHKPDWTRRVSLLPFADEAASFDFDLQCVCWLGIGR